VIPGRADPNRGQNTAPRDRFKRSCGSGRFSRGLPPRGDEAGWPSCSKVTGTGRRQAVIICLGSVTPISCSLSRVLGLELPSPVESARREKLEVNSVQIEAIQVSPCVASADRNDCADQTALRASFRHRARAEGGSASQGCCTACRSPLRLYGTARAATWPPHRHGCVGRRDTVIRGIASSPRSCPLFAESVETVNLRGAPAENSPPRPRPTADNGQRLKAPDDSRLAWPRAGLADQPPQTLVYTPVTCKRALASARRPPTCDK
jgi:hypothetical protein